MEFDIAKEQSSIIKVIGVGGGGSNAVNHMYNLGFKGVDFIVCNTDKQSLDASPVPYKIQLGASLTEGRGAGTIPEIGKNAAIENIDDIRDFLSNNTKMVFITAGMGGGTGTGAAPVIAKTAREMGILTVGIVTVPFNFEGRRRRQQAEQGLENMRESVDTLLVINNERLREIFGNLSLKDAFSQADDILSTAAKGISDVIAVTGAINVDFNDVNTVMKDSGVAVMGSAIAEGDNRAIEAVKKALSSPLLNDNDIEGAEYVLLNITYGAQEVLMDEISDITDYIQDEAGATADVIWGHGFDESLGDAISVTIIATGFNKAPVTGFEKAPEKNVQMLEEEHKKEITNPLTKPTAVSQDFNQEVEEPYIVRREVSETPFEAQNTFKAQEEKVENTFKEEPAEEWELKTNLTEEVVEEEFIEKEQPSFVEPKLEPSEQKPQVIRHILDEDMNVIEESVSEFDEKTKMQELTKEEQQRRSEERMERIKQFTSHMNSAEGLNELEKEPAYRRRNIEIDNSDFSSQSSTSRFEVGDIKRSESDRTLRDTNSFLHDNVD